MTVLSRISGLVRDIAFAQILGTGLFADAFFVAFRIPNFFRRIFAEGAFSSAFVPVYSEVEIYGGAQKAKAFLDLALSPSTTGAILTVDGGNIEAAFR